MPKFAKCYRCKSLLPEVTFCPECGAAVLKWCEQCGEWKPSTYVCLAVERVEGREEPVVTSEWHHDANFCSNCGDRLVTKSGPAQFGMSRPPIESISLAEDDSIEWK
jgi:ribosomal protein L32